MTLGNSSLPSWAVELVAEQEQQAAAMDLQDRVTEGMAGAFDVHDALRMASALRWISYLQVRIAETLERQPINHHLVDQLLEAIDLELSTLEKETP